MLSHLLLFRVGGFFICICVINHDVENINFIICGKIINLHFKKEI